jgi:hypothetical protein
VLLRARLLLLALLAGLDARADAPVHTLLSKEKLHLIPAGQMAELSQALVEFWSQLDEQTQQSVDPNRAMNFGGFRAQPRWVQLSDSELSGALVLEVTDSRSGQVYLSTFHGDQATQVFSGYETLRFDPRTLGVMGDVSELAKLTGELANEVEKTRPAVNEASLDELLGPIPTRLQELKAVWDKDDLETLNQVMDSGSELVKKWHDAEKAYVGTEHDFLYQIVKKGGVIHQGPYGTAELNWVAGQYFMRIKNERTQELFILHSGLNFEDPQVRTLISNYKIAAGQDRPDGQFGRDMNFIFVQDLRHAEETELLDPTRIRREMRSARFASLNWWTDYWRYIKGSTTRETLKADFRFGSFCGAFQGITAACAAGLKEAVASGSGFRWDSILLSMGWGTGIGTIAGPWQRFVGLGSTTVRSVKSTANSLAFYYSLMLLGQGGNVSAFFNFSDAFWPTVMLHLATIGPSFARNVARVYWNNFVIIREAAGVTRDKTWNLKLWPFNRVWKTGFKETRVDAQIRFYMPSFFLGLVDSFFHTPFSWATIPIVELGAKEYARHLADTMEAEKRPGWVKARELSNRMEKAYDRKMLTLFGSDQKFFKLRLKRMHWKLRSWLPGDTLGSRLRANPRLLERLDQQIAKEPGLDVQTLRLKRLYARLMGDRETMDEIGTLLNKTYPEVFQYITEADKKAFHAVAFNMPRSDSVSRLANPRVPKGCVDSLKGFLAILPLRAQ